MYPVYNEVVAASDGRKTTREQSSRPSRLIWLIEPVAECAIFERYSIRKKEWTPVDPPPQLVRTLLAREKRWQFPQVSGIITTPTLRFDGSILCTPGYDQRSELYLVSGLTLPPIPEKPSDAQALTGLDMLKDLFSEFSFQQAGLDRSVALAGLLTALFARQFADLAVVPGPW